MRASFYNRLALIIAVRCLLTGAYKDMKGDEKCKKWGGLGRRLGVTIICVILRLAVLIKYRSVTDIQTHRRTHDDSIHVYRA